MEEHRHESDLEHWRMVLTGEDPYLRRFQNFFGRLPAAPRCKLCRAPFAGPFVPVLRMLGFARWQLSSQLCVCCIRGLDKESGGAEVEVSVLFADVRGSTSIAETMDPTDFSRALNGFYTTTSKVVDAESGVIDHIAGDGMLALWIPAFTGDHHADRALDAGRELARRMSADDQLPTGVAVHTGAAYVGVVGELGTRDFTVLGDVPNTVARMASAAMAGELFISEAIATTVDLETTGLKRRTLDLKGKTGSVTVWVEDLTSQRVSP